MTRVRSPGYPGCSLQQAIEIIEKIFNKVRRNPIDRESAMVEAGYARMSGATSKMLSNLAHYGLIEKVGSGDIRVSGLAVRCLLPSNEGERREALQESAFKPELFAKIRGQFPDGFVSERALQNLLRREEFAESAIQPAVRSYLDTYGYLTQNNALSRYEPDKEGATMSELEIDSSFELRSDSKRADVAPPISAALSSSYAMPSAREPNETEWLRNQVGAESTVRILVSGPIGVREIGKLIKLLEAQKSVLEDDD